MSVPSAASSPVEPGDQQKKQASEQAIKDLFTPCTSSLARKFIVIEDGQLKTKELSFRELLAGKKPDSLEKIALFCAEKGIDDSALCERYGKYLIDKIKKIKDRPFASKQIEYIFKSFTEKQLSSPDSQKQIQNTIDTFSKSLQKTKAAADADTALIALDRLSITDAEKVKRAITILEHCEDNSVDYACLIGFIEKAITQNNEMGVKLFIDKLKVLDPKADKLLTNPKLYTFDFSPRQFEKLLNLARRACNSWCIFESSKKSNLKCKITMGMLHRFLFDVKSKCARLKKLIGEGHEEWNRIVEQHVVDFISFAINNVYLKPHDIIVIKTLIDMLPQQQQVELTKKLQEAIANMDEVAIMNAFSTKSLVTKDDHLFLASLLEKKLLNDTTLVYLQQIFNKNINNTSAQLLRSILGTLIQRSAKPLAPHLSTIERMMTRYDTLIHRAMQFGKTAPQVLRTAYFMEVTLHKADHLFKERYSEMDTGGLAVVKGKDALQIVVGESVWENKKIRVLNLATEPTKLFMRVVTEPNAKKPQKAAGELHALWLSEVKGNRKLSHLVMTAKSILRETEGKPDIQEFCKDLLSKVFSSSSSLKVFSIETAERAFAHLRFMLDTAKEEMGTIKWLETESAMASLATYTKYTLNKMYTSTHPTQIPHSPLFNASDAMVAYENEYALKIAQVVMRPDGTINRGLIADVKQCLLSPSHDQVAFEQNIDKVLTQLYESERLCTLLEGVKVPDDSSVGAKIIRTTLHLANDVPLTPAHAKTCVLASVLSPWRQYGYGSCHTTALVQLTRDMTLKWVLEDFIELIEKGVISRHVVDFEIPREEKDLFHLPPKTQNIDAIISEFKRKVSNSGIKFEDAQIKQAIESLKAENIPITFFQILKKLKSTSISFLGIAKMTPYFLHKPFALTDTDELIRQYKTFPSIVRAFACLDVQEAQIKQAIDSLKATKTALTLFQVIEQLKKELSIPEQKVKEALWEAASTVEQPLSRVAENAVMSMQCVPFSIDGMQTNQRDAYEWALYNIFKSFNLKLGPYYGVVCFRSLPQIKQVRLFAEPPDNPGETHARFALYREVAPNRFVRIETEEECGKFIKDLIKDLCGVTIPSSYKEIATEFHKNFKVQFSGYDAKDSELNFELKAADSVPFAATYLRAERETTDIHTVGFTNVTSAMYATIQWAQEIRKTLGNQDSTVTVPVRSPDHIFRMMPNDPTLSLPAHETMEEWVKKKERAISALKASASPRTTDYMMQAISIHLKTIDSSLTEDILKQKLANNFKAAGISPETISLTEWIAHFLRLAETLNGGKPLPDAALKRLDEWCFQGLFEDHQRVLTQEQALIHFADTNWERTRDKRTLPVHFCFAFNPRTGAWQTVATTNPPSTFALESFPWIRMYSMVSQLKPHVAEKQLLVTRGAVRDRLKKEKDNIYLLANYIKIVKTNIPREIKEKIAKCPSNTNDLNKLLLSLYDQYRGKGMEEIGVIVALAELIKNKAEYQKALDDLCQNQEPPIDLLLEEIFVTHFEARSDLIELLDADPETFSQKLQELVCKD